MQRTTAMRIVAKRDALQEAGVRELGATNDTNILIAYMVHPALATRQKRPDWACGGRLARILVLAEVSCAMGGSAGLKRKGASDGTS